MHFWLDSGKPWGSIVQAKQMRALAGWWGNFEHGRLNLISLCLESGEARPNAVVSCETAQTPLIIFFHTISSRKQ